MSFERRDALLCFALIAAVLASCVGTDVGNPPDDRRSIATLTFEAHDESGDEQALSDGTRVTPSALLLTDGSEVEEAWLAVESISLLGCSRGGDQTVEGPFAVEIVSGVVYPGPVTFEGVRRDSCRLRVRLGVAKMLPDEAPDELVGRSLYLRGLTSEGDAYRIDSSAPRMMTYEGSGLALDEPEVRFVNTFAPASWLDGIDVGSIRGMSDADPIDLSEDAEAVARFLVNLAHSSRIVRDANRDGVVSEQEYAEPAGSLR